MTLIEWVLMLLSIVLGIVGGFIISIYSSPSNRVFYLRERDGRGLELNISTENSVSLETKSNPELRFFKWGRAYEFIGRFRKKFTTFFGKEGTAYTWVLKGYHPENVYSDVREYSIYDTPEGEIEWEEEGQVLVSSVPKRYEIEFNSLAEAVQHKWGELFYDTVPAAQKEQLEEERLLVTVELEPGFTPEGYKPITEADINNSGDEDIMNLWAKGAKGVLSGNTIETMMTLGMGGFITLAAALLLGYIQVG